VGAGCSHSGVGVILDAASCHGEVYGIIGGLHGFRDFHRLDGLSLICPCHCTQHKSELRSLFPEQYVACGVRLPIFVLLAGTFFTANQGLVVFSMYIIGIIVAILMALILRKTVLKGPSGHFVMELPPYRLPTITGVLVHT
jgi:hypothetical protein